MSVFDRLNENIVNFLDGFQNVIDKNKEKRLGEWLDNDDVCRMFGISLRTLQNLRSSDAIGYTKICNKVYYRADDVEKALVRKNIPVKSKGK